MPHEKKKFFKQKVQHYICKFMLSNIIFKLILNLSDNLSLTLGEKMVLQMCLLLLLKELLLKLQQVFTGNPENSRIS